MRKYTLLFVMLLLLGTVVGWSAEEGAWKTAYFKRGFVGNFDANWAGGLGATLRMRVPISFAGTKVRLYARGCYDAETELTKMALVKGADDQGKITGPLYPVLFSGQQELKLEKGLKEAVSDPVDVPVTPGTWYLEDRYASQKFPYAYDVDKEFTESGDKFDSPTLAKSTGSRLGIIYRIDVFTTDTRGTVACYGDSITHGYASTPNAGHRYPDILAKLLDRPTLNLGVNGDVIKYAGGAPGVLKSLPGVDTVVFLMGINDIISDPHFSKADFTKYARFFIDGCHARKLRVYIGTILPASGNKAFDKDPAKETLRTDINKWISAESGADGVIDFASTLADPANPAKFNADYQSGDWLHPNDAGYQQMAEAVAKVLRPK